MIQLNSMNAIVPLLLLFSLLVSPLHLSAQTKRALVIGLGEQQDKSWAKINGDKDVPYVQTMLERSGYGEITALVNQQATKAGIVDAFQNLAAKCGPGDVVYIHFSGHGQLVTDVDGDEDDGWDESWIPYDAYLKYGENDKGEKHLIDDELNVLLTSIRKSIGENGKMLVAVDACHSGDSSRGDDIEETVRGVYYEFLIPVSERGKAEKGLELWLTLSACKDYQLNQELKAPQVGKLSYALYSISEDGEVTMESIQRFMLSHRSRLPQTPVLTGETKQYDLKDVLK